MVTVLRAVAALVVSRLEYLLTNPWLIGAVALLTVNLGAIAVTGANELVQHEERHALELQQRLRATVQPIGPVGRQVDRALRVIRPPSSAAILIVGQEPTMPAGWDLGPAAVEALPPYPPLRASTHLGSTDGAAFIGQFGGLLALVLGLTTVLRDRRRGWVDAERGTTTPSTLFLAANILAACLALAVAVAILFMAVALVIHQLVGDLWQEITTTIQVLALITWLYLVALYAYGAAIAWYVRVPLRAVATAAVLWVCLWLVAPQLLSSWPGWSGDIPSRARAEQGQRDTYTDRVRQMEAELERKIAARVGNSPSAFERDRRATAAFLEMEPAWIGGMVDARTRADTLEIAWQAQVDRAALTLQRAARVTPNTLFPQLLAEVNGTGDLSRRRWNEAVREYKKKLDRVLFDDRPTVILRLPLDGFVESWMHQRHRVKPFRDLPQFVAPTITARDRWQAAKSDALVLALHALAALTVAGIAHRRAWRRYDFASVSAVDVGMP